MKVLESKILIQPVKKDEAVEKYGGFEVPVGAGEYSVAKVISIGPKVEGNIKEGDTVYYYPNSGKEITVTDGKYRVITSSEVLVVL
jgi:co-chaperonin GroES (HSP10)